MSESKGLHPTWKKTLEHVEGRRASKQYRALEEKLHSSTYDTRSKLAKIADLVDMPLLPSKSSKQSFRGGVSNSSWDKFCNKFREKQLW